MRRVDGVIESFLGAERRDGVTGIDFALPGRSTSFFFLSGDSSAPFKRALDFPGEVTDLRGFILGGRFSFSSGSNSFVAGVEATRFSTGDASMCEASHTSKPG